MAPPPVLANLVETAIKAGSFTFLLAAAKKAGLLDTLRGKGPLTLFAPNDEAFEKLPPSTVKDLLMPANRAKLVSILAYHIVSGRIASKDFRSKAMKAGSAGGADLSPDATQEFMVDRARVITADIQASNGIMHVISSLLMPPVRLRNL